MTNENLTDIELLKKISKYSSRSLEELYHRYSDIIYSLVIKIVDNPTIAEDIVADIFTTILRKSYKINFDNISPFTWIMLLSRNKAVDYLHRQRDLNLQEFNDFYEDKYILPYIDKKIDTIDFELSNKLSSKFNDSYSMLTDSQRLVIEKAFFSGYNFEDISKELLIPTETIRSKVMTALYSLQENLLSDE